MCGKAPKTPKVIERDPIAEQRQAEAEAQVKANSETAARRRRRNASGGGLSGMRAAMLGTGGEAKSLLAQATPKP